MQQLGQQPPGEPVADDDDDPERQDRLGGARDARRAQEGGGGDERAGVERGGAVRCRSRARREGPRRSRPPSTRSAAPGRRGPRGRRARRAAAAGLTTQPTRTSDQAAAVAHSLGSSKNPPVQKASTAGPASRTPADAAMTTRRIDGHRSRRAGRPGPPVGSARIWSNAHLPARSALTPAEEEAPGPRTAPRRLVRRASGADRSSRTASPALLGWPRRRHPRRRRGRASRSPPGGRRSATTPSSPSAASTSSRSTHHSWASGRRARRPSSARTPTAGAPAVLARGGARARARRGRDPPGRRR